MAQIVTLTLNPCVDRTVPDGDLSASFDQTGGKGINVARVLANAGMDVLAVAPVGAGENGRLFAMLAKDEGIPLQSISVAADTRVITTHWNRAANAQTVDYEKGSDLTEAEIALLREELQKSLFGAQLLIVSGSAPGPLTQAFTGEAIAIAKSMGVETLLDSNGPALDMGFAAGPGLVKPNQAECMQLLGRDIPLGEEGAAAEELLAANFARGVHHVVVSLGEKGALWAREGGTIFCPAPKIKCINAVGSGDSFVAGFVYALLSNYSDSGALALACAAGAANAAEFPAARIQLNKILH